jgi:dTDP-4-amino-4,6-dideoxygalactose transaminase
MNMMRLRDDFLVFGQPVITDDQIEEVVDSLKSGWLGTGPKATAFEAAFAKYKGVGSAVAVNSCTAALHLSMLAADLKAGDEVITSALTFCATVNAIIHAGATPVLADVDPETMNVSAETLRQRIGFRTRAVIVVHFGGRPCEMDAIVELCRRHDLVLIEDCAHAVETTYKGIPVGVFGDFACFSFYATKNITTGEGGMILAKNPEHIERLKVLALHGMSHHAWRRYGDSGYKHYQVVECGFKYNMMDIQAAIGIHQLEKIETWSKRRIHISGRYRAGLRHLPVVLPSGADSNSRHAWHLFPILIDLVRAGIERDLFLEEMTRRQVGVGVHYLSIPEHPYYRQRFHWDPAEYPAAFRIGRQTVSLPISAKLKDSDVDYVIEAVSDSLRPAIR